MSLVSVQHPNLPTFYLNDSVQGIVSPAHAQLIASRITNRPAEEHSVYFLDPDEDLS